MDNIASFNAFKILMIGFLYLLMLFALVLVAGIAHIWFGFLCRFLSKDVYYCAKSPIYLYSFINIRTSWCSLWMYMSMQKWKNFYWSLPCIFYWYQVLSLLLVCWVYDQFCYLINKIVPVFISYKFYFLLLDTVKYFYCLIIRGTNEWHCKYQRFKNTDFGFCVHIHDNQHRSDCRICRSLI